MASQDNKLRIPETLRRVKNIIGIFSAKGSREVGNFSSDCVSS